MSTNRYKDIVMPNYEHCILGTISSILKYYNGIKMTIEYSVTDKETGELRCVGETRHCFLNRDGKPVSLKKVYLEMDEMFQKALPQKED